MYTMKYDPHFGPSSATIFSSNVFSLLSSGLFLYNQVQLVPFMFVYGCGAIY